MFVCAWVRYSLANHLCCFCRCNSTQRDPHSTPRQVQHPLGALMHIPEPWSRFHLHSCVSETATRRGSCVRHSTILTHTRASCSVAKIRMPVPKLARVHALQSVLPLATLPGSIYECTLAEVLDVDHSHGMVKRSVALTFPTDVCNVAERHEQA